MKTEIEPEYAEISDERAMEIAETLSLRKSENKLVWQKLEAMQDYEDRHSRRWFVANRNKVWAQRRKLIEARD